MNNRLLNIAGALTIAIAAAVMIAWALRFDPVLTVLPGNAAPMQFNTALCFLLTGLGAVSASRTRFVFCAAALGIASATLLQDVTGADFAIDELFIKAHITTETPHAGRMAPATALGFIGLTAGAILERARHFRETLWTVTAAISALALLGYIGLGHYYSWGAGTSSMAIHTALLQLLIAAAFLSNNPRPKPAGNLDKPAARFKSDLKRIRRKQSRGETLTADEISFLNITRGMK